MRRAHIWLIVLLEIWLLLSACAVEISENTECVRRATRRRRPVPMSTIPAGPQIGNSLEFRHVRLKTGQQSGELAILRLDPHAYRIRVAYDAANPGRVSEWAKAIKPVALINGGYFDAQGKATALVIFDGIPQGASYEGFGGMVVVNSQGEFELRSLRQQPYDPDEPLQQAMQSSPMLIQPGGKLIRS